MLTGHDGNAALRPARHRRADRRALRLRARGRRLLRGDRVEQDPDPGGKALLHVCTPVGAAPPAGEAASATGFGLARTGLPRLLPGPGRARRDADRADRRADPLHRRPHVSENGRQFGLGLQTDKRLGDYGPLARLAEDAGFDVVTTFNDLWFQPALP